jgi:hypothetical protein
MYIQIPMKKIQPLPHPLGYRHPLGFQASEVAVTSVVIAIVRLVTQLVFHVGCHQKCLEMGS